LTCQYNSILEKKPRLQKKYKRPDPRNDRLYHSRVTHPPNTDTGCIVICGDDLSKLMSRPERTQDEDNPAIHYGLIASANQLMKDTLIRDRLAVEKDVLCFEIEAAGLINHFPCLVICSIYDYSDPYKNNKWQGYTATMKRCVSCTYHMLRTFQYVIAEDSFLIRERRSCRHRGCLSC
jgi:nucleoside phosphorylase